jgi:hypothetical protein
MFFFEKKNQKTFPTLGRADDEGPAQMGEVFLLLFLQKKKISYFLLIWNAVLSAVNPEAR